MATEASETEANTNQTDEDVSDRFHDAIEVIEDCHDEEHVRHNEPQEQHHSSDKYTSNSVEEIFKCIACHAIPRDEIFQVGNSIDSGHFLGHLLPY